jgi:hypothetical protein
MNIEPALLRRLLTYDQNTGTLTWRKRSVDLFENEYRTRTAQHACNNWNSRYAGKAAFATNNVMGYKRGMVLNKLHQAHRVIWAIVCDEWPAEDIDHINGVKDDNRISNLRSVTHSENQKNQAMYSNNSSGAVGVYWDNTSGKWLAEIKTNGKKKFLGRFKDKNDAIAVRRGAEKMFGFHINHGRKA